MRDMLLHLKGADWSNATQSRAQVGYPDDPTQTWIVLLSGRPEISATVTPAEADFEATPDTICHS